MWHRKIEGRGGTRAKAGMRSRAWVDTGTREKACKDVKVRVRASVN